MTYAPCPCLPAWIISVADASRALDLCAGQGELKAHLQLVALEATAVKHAAKVSG
jgi:hypothetical protein